MSKDLTAKAAAPALSFAAYVLLVASLARLPLPPSPRPARKRLTPEQRAEHLRKHREGMAAYMRLWRRRKLGRVDS